MTDKNPKNDVEFEKEKIYTEQQMMIAAGEFIRATNRINTAALHMVPGIALFLYGMCCCVLYLFFSFPWNYFVTVALLAQILFGLMLCFKGRVIAIRAGVL